MDLRGRIPPSRLIHGDRGQVRNRYCKGTVKKYVIFVVLVILVITYLLVILVITSYKLLLVILD